MSLLIDIRDPGWMTEEDLRDQIAPLLPDVTIHAGIDDGDMTDVTMMAAVQLFPGVAAGLPSLQMIQKLGAGVDGIVRDPDLPSHVRVTRLKPDGPAQEIAEYCLAYVLREQRNMPAHEADTAKKKWVQIAPRITSELTVGVLGLGHIGGRTARLFAQMGYRVLGWARSQKSIDGVDCRAGLDALPAMLGECDFVCSILPSTPDTVDLFDKTLLGKMKQGAVFINAGRGDLIVDADLIAALDTGLGGAVLDVFRSEPLPEDHPYWTHDKVTITPHVSGWHAEDAHIAIAENYKRLTEGRPLLNEIDRSAGY